MHQWAAAGRSVAKTRQRNIKARAVAPPREQWWPQRAQTMEQREGASTKEQSYCRDRPEHLRRDPMGARELKIQKMGGEGEKRLEANTIFVCIPLLQISPLTGPS